MSIGGAEPRVVGVVVAKTPTALLGSGTAEERRRAGNGGSEGGRRRWKGLRLKAWAVVGGKVIKIGLGKG